MRTVAVVLVAFTLAFLGGGCLNPAPPPGPALSAKAAAAQAYYPDSKAAIEFAFSRFGPNVVVCAKNYAARESGMWPDADNGTHHGMFQMHDGYWGSIVAAQQTLGHLAPSWYDPWQNALAASYGYQASGWRAWVPRLAGC